MLGGRERRRPSIGESAARKHRPDYALVIIAVILLLLGLIVVYAISPGVSLQKGVSEGYYVSKQLIAIVLGIIAFVTLSRVPYRWWRTAAVPLMVASAIASVAVLLFGTKVNGAYRWIQVGGISFQAAELIKFSILIWMANFLAVRKGDGLLASTERTLKPIGIILVLIAIVVATLQSDLGSTAVIVAMMAAMMMVAGVPMKKLILIGTAVMVGLVLVVSTVSYRRSRLATFLHPSSDCQNTGYQTCQAMIAVGSGGVVGLGLGRSVQAYGYLPEAANDSIFAILAEKFGFIGVTVVIALYAAFFARLSRISQHAPDDFSALLLVGMMVWFSVQAFINIGAMIGLLPLKGITLPFISYGGTSLLFVTGCLGIAFQISRYTTYGTLDTLRGGAGNEDTSPYRRGIGRTHNANPSRRA